MTSGSVPNVRFCHNMDDLLESVIEDLVNMTWSIFCHVNRPCRGETSSLISWQSQILMTVTVTF